MTMKQQSNTSPLCSQCDVDALWCDAGLCRSELNLITLLFFVVYGDTLLSQILHEIVETHAFILRIYCAVLSRQYLCADITYDLKLPKISPL